MSDPTPERTVPAEVVYAIERLKVAAYKAGRGDDGATDGTKEMASLYATIIAALEPDRALRERAERLRKVAIDARYGKRHHYCMEFAEASMNALQPGDLKNDLLTATSSAHEGREESLSPEKVTSQK